MRLIYLGSPAFVLSPLRQLVAAGHEVLAVVTPPPRPAGRGRKLQQPPLAEEALRLELPLLQSDAVSAPEFLATLAAVGAEVAITAAFGQYLKRGFLQLFPQGVLNIHPSLLPALRGASPVVSFLLGAEERTGVSVLRSVRRMDAGPILGQRETAIAPQESAGALTERLFALGGELLVDLLAQLAQGPVAEREQDEGAATHCSRIERSMARLDFSRPAWRLARDVQAFDPWPVAWTELAGRGLRVWRARVESGPAPAGLTCGSVLGPPQGGALQVVCGEGLVGLEELQLEGSRRMSADELWRGLKPGEGPLVLGG